jgi:hypothetical protein
VAVLALTGAVVVAAAGVLTAIPGLLRAGLAAQAAGMALLGAAGAAALIAEEPLGAGFREGASPRSGSTR